MLFSTAASAITSNDYDLYRSGNTFYLKSDPTWVPIAGSITIFVPTYKDGEIIKLTQSSNGEWVSENISFSEFESASPTNLGTSQVSYMDANNDGVTDIVVVLNGQTVRLIADDNASGGFSFSTAQAGISYLHTDHLGSVVAKTNEAGLVTERYHYTPFGQPEDPSILNNEVSYTGHVYDDDINLTYMQARYYDPVIGRFYSNDPVDALGHFYEGNGIQGFNRFAYANNNPYKYIDPDGRKIELKTDEMNTINFKKQYSEAKQQLEEAGEGSYLQKLEDSDTVITITDTSGFHDLSYKDNNINWDPTSGLKVEGGVQSPALGLLHEADHALQELTNEKQFENDRNTPDQQYGNLEEKRVITGSESRAAQALGQPTRNSHGGRPVGVKCATCTEL